MMTAEDRQEVLLDVGEHWHCCMRPVRLYSNRLATETGIERVCILCERCGNWSCWRFRGPLRTDRLLEATSVLPHRWPTAYTFPVKVPIRRIIARNKEPERG